VLVVLGEVIRDTAHSRVHVSTAELLGRDDLAGCGLHERRPTEEDRSLLLDDDVFIAHRRHVCAARRARPHYRRDLRDAHRGHHGLVVERLSTVSLVGKDFGLQG
jgi:hypothetical protein